MPNAPVELLRKFEARATPERLARLLEDAREIAERVGLREARSGSLDAMMEGLGDELARLDAETFAVIAAAHAVEAERHRRGLLHLVAS